ncbi:hypothetical protein [Butyrivibrio sp.]|jgi:peptidoglycan/xylan/chitin deacetylase (PgdA/CDA1 family)|uniref:hypothetical protein n=1 Tax=Butyrivibrio sp. TaxID=28121 RepID=UPI0025C732AD|nr:hypothetical protein [Butyrivibrio sp.]MBE5838865.1 hypothetical protein [Butyrivibrio sp.]
MNYFIVTVDAEGDNIWNWDGKGSITTENTLYLSRFQYLCEKYGFKPVWLANWEIIHDARFVTLIKSALNRDMCEIGSHIHAWNNPPFFEIEKAPKRGLPYLIEYPVEVMEKKIATITEEICSIFEINPISHRAGRWAINDEMLRVLYKYGYKVDCSVTPNIDWSSSHGQKEGVKGPNYLGEKREISYREGIMEVPVTTWKNDKIYVDSLPKRGMIKSLKYIGSGLLKKRKYKLFRPDKYNVTEIIDNISSEDLDDIGYLMFMIHSSELMPGGSPYFASPLDIENLYSEIETIFNLVASKYEGITLKDFYNTVKSEIEIV